VSRSAVIIDRLSQLLESNETNNTDIEAIKADLELIASHIKKLNLINSDIEISAKVGSVNKSIKINKSTISEGRTKGSTNKKGKKETSPGEIKPDWHDLFTLSKSLPFIFNGAKYMYRHTGFGFNVKLGPNVGVKINKSVAGKWSTTVKVSQEARGFNILVKDALSIEALSDKLSEKIKNYLPADAQT